MKKILIIAMVLIPTLAKAEWIEVDRDKEFTFYLDPARIVFTNKSSGYAETWMKAVIHTDLTKDGLSVGDHRITKFKFRCQSKELAIAAAYSYKNGSVQDSYIPSYPNFKPAIPDSRGEVLLDLICEGD